MAKEQLPDYHADDPPPGSGPFRDDPAPPRLRSRSFADGLAAVLGKAMARHWPAMRAALDEEVLHRARALAADGPDALLSGLHKRAVGSGRC